MFVTYFLIFMFGSSCWYSVILNCLVLVWSPARQPSTLWKLMGIQIKNKEYQNVILFLWKKKKHKSTRHVPVALWTVKCNFIKYSGPGRCSGAHDRRQKPASHYLKLFAGRSQDVLRCFTALQTSQIECCFSQSARYALDHFNSWQNMFLLVWPSQN